MFGMYSFEVGGIKKVVWEDDSGLRITGEQSVLPGEKGMWKFVIADEMGKDYVIVFWATKTIPSIIDVYNSLRVSINNLKSAREWTVGHRLSRFPNSNGTEIQLQTYFRDKLKAIIKDIFLGRKNND